MALHAVYVENDCRWGNSSTPAMQRQPAAVPVNISNRSFQHVLVRTETIVDIWRPTLFVALNCAQELPQNHIIMLLHDFVGPTKQLPLAFMSHEHPKIVIALAATFHDADSDR